ncbi:MAG TPA: DUF2938 domain-containing protein [Burkholderiaceae bacterium]|nr:DUF2938 domain-containing protein [Burkholderiaceae bacterium]
MLAPKDVAHIVLIGVGATAVMDMWLLLLLRLKVQPPSFALIGRWVGNMPRGKFVHASISHAPPVAGELGLGWLTHYGVGIAYACLLVGIQGTEWSLQPSLLPALAVGVGTVVMPLFAMQPAMGAGFAGSRTPTPLKNCLRSVANHAVFGTGLYLAALFIQWISR